MRFSIFIILVLLVGCGDYVETYYPTYQDAIDDKLFERGWLPEFIPESAVDIRVVNDLELNDSMGHFTILDNNELQHFIRCLHQIESEENAYQFLLGEDIWFFRVQNGNRVEYVLEQIELSSD